MHIMETSPKWAGGIALRLLTSTVRSHAAEGQEFGRSQSIHGKCVAVLVQDQVQFYDCFSKVEQRQLCHQLSATIVLHSCCQWCFQS